MTNQELLTAFELNQETRGLSPKTIQRRHYTIRGLAAAASPVPLVEVTPEIIEDWLSKYRKAETKHAFLGDVRCLFKWARRRKLVDEDPTEDMGSIKVPKRLPRPMEEQDLALAIATARDQRLRLVLLLGSFAGLRRFEMAQLRAEDCTRERLVVRAGKGGKDGVIPMHPLLWAALEAYEVQHGWLFDSPTGGHISPGTISSWIRKHFAAIGLNATLHQTRHRFGTRVAEAAEGNMLVVQELMRHANLEDSRRYVAFDTSRLQPVVNGLPVTAELDEVSRRRLLRHSG